MKERSHELSLRKSVRWCGRFHLFAGVLLAPMACGPTNRQLNYTASCGHASARDSLQGARNVVSLLSARLNVAAQINSGSFGFSPAFIALVPAPGEAGVSLQTTFAVMVSSNGKSAEIHIVATPANGESKAELEKAGNLIEKTIAAASCRLTAFSRGMGRR